MLGSTPLLSLGNVVKLLWFGMREQEAALKGWSEVIFLLVFYYEEGALDMVCAYP